MSGKGSGRRPTAVSEDVVDESWTRTFARGGLYDTPEMQRALAEDQVKLDALSGCSGQCGFCAGECVGRDL